MALKIKANQYNYATPLGSFDNILTEAGALDLPYFSMFNNTLGGTHAPIENSAGYWSSAFAGSTGVLSQPVIIEVEGPQTIHSIALRGYVGTGANTSVWPVNYTVKLYRQAVLQHTVTVVDNNEVYNLTKLSKVFEIDKYELTVTKINKSNYPLILLSVFNPYVVSRTDAISISLSESSSISVATYIKKAASDLLYAPSKSSTKVKVESLKSIDYAIALNEEPKVINIHSIMKQPFRQVYGKVQITYNNPLVENTVTFSASSTAYNSAVNQVSDGKNISHKHFALYDNKLDGSYSVIDDSSETGWWSSSLSDTNGIFKVPQTASIFFVSMPVLGLTVIGDETKGSFPVDFTVTGVSDTEVFTATVVGNNSVACVVDIEPWPDITSLTFSVTKVSKPGYPVAIAEVPLMSTIEYVAKDLIDISLLEELTYADEVQALGGVSANELTVTLNNADKDFYFNNKKSLIANQLKKNRKIVAWLGVEIGKDNLEWYKLGVFWTYKWDVPMGALIARAVAFDTIGLLSTTSFYKHTVYINKSIGELFEVIFNDATSVLKSLTYSISSELYQVILPTVWFQYGSHMQAMNDLAGCYPINVYCDREGTVVVKTQAKATLPLDTWSDKTNIMEKAYPTLYTAAPNIVNVPISSVVVASSQVLQYEIPFVVNGTETKAFMFSSPAVGSVVHTVVMPDTVTVSFETYSWGTYATFVGSGTVSSLLITADAISTAQNAAVSRTNQSSVVQDGPIVRTINSSFIQTEDLAVYLAERTLGASAASRYNAEVKYRGDISLTIGDTINLLDGIATTDLYQITRHELFWNGALSGSTFLRT